MCIYIYVLVYLFIVLGYVFQNVYVDIYIYTHEHLFNILRFCKAPFTIPLSRHQHPAAQPSAMLSCFRLWLSGLRGLGHRDEAGVAA